MDEADIKIAPMSVRDVAQVIAIERTVYPTPWSEHSFISEIKDNACALYIVARIDAKVLGYAGVWVFLGGSHITTIAVDPSVQGRGIGSELLLELMARSGARGAVRMTLEVRPTNERAVKMYERFGFRERGIRPGYYTDTGEDALVMWLDDIRKQVALRSGYGGGQI